MVFSFQLPTTNLSFTRTLEERLETTPKTQLICKGEGTTRWVMKPVTCRSVNALVAQHHWANKHRTLVRRLLKYSKLDILSGYPINLNLTRSYLLTPSWHRWTDLIEFDPTSDSPRIRISLQIRNYFFAYVRPPIPLSSMSYSFSITVELHLWPWSF